MPQAKASVSGRGSVRRKISERQSVRLFAFTVTQAELNSLLSGKFLTVRQLGAKLFSTRMERGPDEGRGEGRMRKRTAVAALAALLLTGAALGDEVVSPPYTVLVNLEYQSTYVDDGRSTFADFAFSVTFENVRFHFEKDQPLPSMAFRVEGGNRGKGILSRWALNKVETGGKAVMPKVSRAPQRDFEAWLGITPGPFRMEWGVPDEMLQFPMPLQFMTSWGMDMMKWDYEVGDAYLEEVGLEAFLVDWDLLSKGEPVSITLPYPGSYPEEKGNWWIEFIPKKK